jgi:hypothetical protein
VRSRADGSRLLDFIDHDVGDGLQVLTFDHRHHIEPTGHGEDLRNTGNLFQLPCQIEGFTRLGPYIDQGPHFLQKILNL